MAKCCNCSPKVKLFFRVLYAIIGILCGLVGCIVFLVKIDNKDAAYLALISAVFAAGSLGFIIYLHVRQEVQQSQPHIPVLCVFGLKGAIGISLGVGAFVVFMGLGIIDSINHKVLSLSHTHYIASVWALMIFKYGLMLFIFALTKKTSMPGNKLKSVA